MGSVKTDEGSGQLKSTWDLFSTYTIIAVKVSFYISNTFQDSEMSLMVFYSVFFISTCTNIRLNRLEFFQASGYQTFSDASTQIIELDSF